MKTAFGGVAGLVAAVIGSTVRSSEDTVVAKVWVVVKLSRVEIDLGLPSTYAFGEISWFSIESERSALRVGRVSFVKTGRGGDVC